MKQLLALRYRRARWRALFALPPRRPLPSADPVLKAMHDEIERARKLTLTNLEAPYFIEYVVAMKDATSPVSASLGGLLSRRHDRFRAPHVHVRVGDYKFDNSNYAAALQLRLALRPGALSAGGFLSAAAALLLADDRFGVQIRRGGHLPQARRPAQHHSRASSSTISPTPSRSRACARSSPWRSTKISWAGACARSPRSSSSYPESTTRGVELEASEGGFTW